MTFRQSTVLVSRSIYFLTFLKLKNDLKKKTIVHYPLSSTYNRFKKKLTLLMAFYFILELGKK